MKALPQVVVGSRLSDRSLSTLAAVASTIRDRQPLSSVFDKPASASSDNTLPSFSEMFATVTTACTTHVGASNSAPARQIVDLTQARTVPRSVEQLLHGGVEVQKQTPEYIRERGRAVHHSKVIMERILRVCTPVTKPVPKKDALDLRLLSGMMEAVRFSVCTQIVRPSTWVIDDASISATSQGLLHAIYLDSVMVTDTCKHETKQTLVPANLHPTCAVKVAVNDKILAASCGQCLRRLFGRYRVKVGVETDGTLWYRVIPTLPGGSREKQRQNKKQPPKRGAAIRPDAPPEETGGVFLNQRGDGVLKNIKHVAYKAKTKTETKPLVITERPKIEATYEAMAASVSEEEESEVATDTKPVLTATVDDKGVGPSGETSSNWTDYLTVVTEPEIQIPTPARVSPPPPSAPLRDEVRPMEQKHSHRYGVCECEVMCFPVITSHLRATRESPGCPFTAQGMNARLIQMHKERKDTNPKNLDYDPSVMRNLYTFCAVPKEYNRMPKRPNTEELAKMYSYISNRFKKDPLRYTQDETSNFWLSGIGHMTHQAEKLVGRKIDTTDPRFTVDLDEFFDAAYGRIVYSDCTRGTCDWDWCPVPPGITPKAGFLLARPIPGNPHIPVGSAAVRLTPALKQWTTNVTHPTIGFVSRFVVGSSLVLKDAVFTVYMANLPTQKPTNPSPTTVWGKIKGIFGSSIPALSATMPAIPGFGVLQGSSNALTSAPLPPTQPPANIKTMSNVFTPGTTYKFNLGMKQTSVSALFNRRLNIRQKLLASGLLKCNPATLGLSPGPVAVDPASCFEVTCETKPLIDVTWDGTQNIDLRCDQARNAELLHKESVVQVWTYRRYYCGMPLAEARFFTDSNVLTAVMSSKSNLHPLLSPETKQALFTEDVYRAMVFCNVDASFNHLVLDAIEAAVLVLQVKSMDKAENRARLGAGGQVPLFH